MSLSSKLLNACSQATCPRMYGKDAAGTAGDRKRPEFRALFPSGGTSVVPPSRVGRFGSPHHPNPAKEKASLTGGLFFGHWEQKRCHAPKVHPQKVGSNGEPSRWALRFFKTLQPSRRAERNSFRRGWDGWRSRDVCLRHSPLKRPLFPSAPPFPSYKAHAPGAAPAVSVRFPLTSDQ